MKKEDKEILLNEILKDLHKSTLSIPVLNGYKVLENPKGAIMVAESDDHSVEQFLEDGKLAKGETFEKRLKKVLKETQKSMVDSGLENRELEYLGELETDLFTFQLYLQDNIMGEKQVRQINAYFLEPESKYFYEITLAAPPLYVKDMNDQVSENIYSRIKPILTHIKYNENNPIQ